MKKILLIGILTLLLTGCNYNIIDTKYTFNYAYCDYDFLPKEIKISKWSDYEGEQLQITDENGNVLLVTSFHCVFTKEKLGE